MRIIIIACVLLCILSTAMFYIGYHDLQERQHVKLREELKTTAARLASTVDADELILLQPDDEGSARYLAINGQLFKARHNNTRVSNAYIFCVRDENLTFIVDDLYGIDADAARIGEPYTSPDHDLIIAALNMPTASTMVYTDQWGSFLSGYAPVKNKQGEAVAVLGVDMPVESVIAYENAGLYHLLEFV